MGYVSASMFTDVLIIRTNEEFQKRKQGIDLGTSNAFETEDG